MVVSKNCQGQINIHYSPVIPLFTIPLWNKYKFCILIDDPIKIQNTHFVYAVPITIYLPPGTPPLEWGTSELTPALLPALGDISGYCL